VAELQYTFIFDMPGHGFTETHWRDIPVGESLEQSFAVGYELARRRQVCSGAETVLQGIRISNAELDGRIGTSQLNAVPGNAQFGSAASNVALNLLVGDTNNEHTKTTQWRGFWDQEEVTGGALLRSSAFLNAFNSWAQYFVAQSFGWRGISATQSFPITNYTVSAAGVVTLTVAGNLAGILPLNKPRSVTISGVNGGRTQLKGEQVVILTAPGADSSVVLKFPMALVPFSGIGFINVHSYTFRDAAAVSMQRIGTRQAGAPLLRSRGRSGKRTRV
jgi:hypothetical protein